MFSFSAPGYRRRRNTAMEFDYDEKKPRKLVAKFLRALKSCFGHGSTIEVDSDVPSRGGYQRAGEPATGFEREEVYGIQAEYLDEDDMAWGKPRKSKKQFLRSHAI